MKLDTEKLLRLFRDILTVDRDVLVSVRELLSAAESDKDALNTLDKLLQHNDNALLLYEDYLKLTEKKGE